MVRNLVCTVFSVCVPASRFSELKVPYTHCASAFFELLISGLVTWISTFARDLASVLRPYGRGTSILFRTKFRTTLAQYFIILQEYRIFKERISKTGLRPHTSQGLWLHAGYRKLIEDWSSSQFRSLWNKNIVLLWISAEAKISSWSSKVVWNAVRLSCRSSHCSYST